MKKNLGFIIAMFALIALVAGGVAWYRANKIAKFTLEEPFTACYWRSINNHDGNDLAFLRANLATDGTVDGVYNESYMNEYKFYGNFLGRWQGDGENFTLHVVHTYDDAGSERNQERIIRINSEEARVGYGELVEQDEFLLYQDRDDLLFYGMLLHAPCEEIPPYVQG